MSFSSQRSQEGFGQAGNRPGSASAMRKDPSLQNIRDAISPPTMQPSSRPISAGIGRPSQNFNLSGMNAPINANPRNYKTNNRPSSANSTSRPSSANISNYKLSPSSTSPVETTPILRPVIPAHVVHEKQVLRFYCQFKEPRPWDQDGPLGRPNIESEIVRKLTVFYFLEDGTFSLMEGASTNGMSGGTFFKRSKVAKGDGTYISPNDFSVGNIIELLGQRILVYDADKKTRDYFRQVLRVIMSPPIDVEPQARQDLGVAMATGAGTYFPEPHDPNGNFRTKSADYDKQKEALNKSYAFYNFDGRVLRFEAVVCVDPKNIEDAEITIGVAKRYAISYSLSDNALEIRSINQKKSSYDEITTFLKKTRLAKNWREVQRGKPPVFYQPSDFICGNIIECYGRFLLVTDCDAFTRGMYEDMGIPQQRIELIVPEPYVIKQNIPKHGDGFLAIGSEEDTLATIHGMPKPDRGLVKLQRNAGRFLRCKTCFVTDSNIDKGREFMVTFNLEDDSIQIYEEIVRNSGLNGGSFLKRGKYINTLPHGSDAPRAFQACDFYLGNVFCINGNEMRITEMDNMSLRFCEAYPDEFPMFDTFRIIQSLLESVTSKRLDVRALMVQFDRNCIGSLTKHVFVFVLDQIGLCAELNDQELLTVMRRFQNGDVYQYDEMCDLFSHVYFIKDQRRRSYGNVRAADQEKTSLLDSLRSHKTQIRRLGRKHVHSLNGHLTLAQLSAVLLRYGFKLSQNHKNIIAKGYSLPLHEAAPLLIKLNQPNELDILEHQNIDDDMKGISRSRPSSGRLDMKSSTRMAGSMSAADIQTRRQEIMQSVLRKPVVSLSNGLERAQPDENDIVISYKSFCDDIYRCDWV